MSKTVFLAYSSAYSNLKDVFVRLMQAMEFDVYVFDHPDEGRVVDVVQDRIRASGAVVVLYGPHDQPAKGEKNLSPAGFVHDEAMFALGTRVEDDKQMPIALFVHLGTSVRDMLQQSQTAARFDFWDPASFQANIHHIYKHLRALQNRMDWKGGDKPFFFRKLEFKYRIESAKKLEMTMYNHAVVRESQSVTEFHHGISPEGGASGNFPSYDKLEFDSGISLGSDSHSLEIDPILKECSEINIGYFARITPPMAAGEEVGYWRTISLPNWFPLTRAEIAGWASKPGYPKHIFGDRFFGDCCNVVNELDSFTWSFRFPNNFRMASFRVVVIDRLTNREYESETARCQKHVTWKPFPDKGENVLELTVPRPHMGYDYFLLYEPKQ